MWFIYINVKGAQTYHVCHTLHVINAYLFIYCHLKCHIEYFHFSALIKSLCPTSPPGGSNTLYWSHSSSSRWNCPPLRQVVVISERLGGGRLVQGLGSSSVLQHVATVPAWALNVWVEDNQNLWFAEPLQALCLIPVGLFTGAGTGWATLVSQQLWLPCAWSPDVFLRS